MAVRQRGRGFQADVKEGPGLPRHRYMFKTEALAKGWEADALAAIANGRPVPEPGVDTHGLRPGVMSFGRGADEFFAEAYAGNKSNWSNVVALYLNMFKKEFGEGTPLADVATDEQMARLTARFHAAGNAQSTINGKLSVLSKYFTWAKKRRHLKEVPEITRTAPDNERGGYVSMDEERKMLRWFVQWEKHEEADAFIALVDSGMRGSELWRLTAADLRDPPSGGDMLMAVRKSKNGKPRSIPATARLRAVLRRRAGAYPEGPLFPGMDNWRFIKVWNRGRDLLNKAEDKDFTPYLLRHTFGSRLAQAGVPMSVIQKLMGHKNINQTMRYAKYAPENFVQAVAALDRINQTGEVIPFPQAQEIAV